LSNSNSPNRTIPNPYLLSSSKYLVKGRGVWKVNWHIGIVKAKGLFRALKEVLECGNDF
jgi:hypothetical protein